MLRNICLAICICLFYGHLGMCAEVNSMNTTTNTIRLTGLNFSRSGMAMRDNYSFTLETTDDGRAVYFSARYFSKGRPAEAYNVVVPTTIMEELSEMAHAAGKLGEPNVQGPPKVQMRDYSTWNYSLQWADGTETGAGTAQKQIVEYLHVLVKKHADGELQDGVSQQVPTTPESGYAHPADTTSTPVNIAPTADTTISSHNTRDLLNVQKR